MLVTVPPFIQRASKENLLAEFTPQGSEQIPGANARYSPLVNNYLTLSTTITAENRPGQLAGTAGQSLQKQAAVLDAGPGR